MKKHYLNISLLFTSIFLFFQGLTFTSAGINNEEIENSIYKASFVPDGNKGKIVNFTLIDADKNTELTEIEDGAIINLVETGTRHINIRANTDPSKIGSVLFKLTGPKDYEHVENIAPYALFANDKNDYFKWTPQPGIYTLAATPFSKDSGTGDAGETLTISFEIIDDIQVTGFVLVNADDNKDIFEITEGMEIDLKKLPSQNINIRANTLPEKVGSVELSITDQEEDNFYSHIENSVPYALFSDHKGNYYGRIAENGNFSVKAIPYLSNHARGKQGYSLNISFKMINAEDVSSLSFMRSDIVLESFTVFPNPGKNALNIFLENPGSNNIRIQILDLMGNEVLDKNKETGMKSTNIMLDVSGLENKPYVIKLISDEGISSVRWFKE